MILCAGLGTRLRPLTDWCPKPLVPIGDRPALAHILDRLVGVRCVVNAHHRGAELEAFARARSGEVLVSTEVDLLGTAGGVAFASPLLGAGDVLVWNGDILLDLDPNDLVRAHRSEATLVVRTGPKGTGNVGTDDRGRIVRLRQETVSPG
ncbi:MAG: sugar phosphate nucleotidyltransferase, partial [Polyangiaceae bacterium]